MGEALVEADAHRAAPRVAPGEVAPAVFQRVRTAAEHGDLCRQVERARGDVEQQVEALLLGEAAHHRQQRPVGAHLEAHFRLQRGLVRGLVFQPARAVMLDQVAVVRRVPVAGVDAVEDAGEVRRAMSQQAGHAHAFGIGLDLAGVGRAHRADRGGMLQAGLEEGQVAVELDAVHAPGRIRQAQFEQGGVVEKALEGQVVHRDQRPGRAFGAVGEIGRRQRGLPVVAVDHVGYPVQAAGLGAEPGGDAREQAEAQVVVEPVAAFGTEVGIAGSFVIGAVVEQQQRCAVGRCRLAQAGCRQQAAQPVRTRNFKCVGEGA